MAWYIDKDGLATTSGSVPVTNVLQLLVLLMWTCLRITVLSKNPIFDLVFPDMSTITDLVSSCSLVCAPGLCDILQSSTAPSLKKLKSFPSNFRKRWAVYLLVLEKPLCVPRTYVGSGTASQEGVSQRMSQYSCLANLPRYVDESIREGYIITHKGLLVWAPIPALLDRPLVKAMFILLEAMLTFVFWAVKNKVGGGFVSFGLPSLWAWAFKDLEYTSLCSHNPLSEQLGIDFALSAEELEALDKLRKRNEAARKLIPNRLNVAKVREEQRYYCAPCKYSAAHLENWDKHLKSERHLREIAGRASTTGIRRKDRARTIRSKKYYCATCDYSAVHQQNLTVHLNSQKHLKKALESSSGSSS